MKISWNKMNEMMSMSSSFQVYCSNGDCCGRLDRILRVRRTRLHSTAFLSTQSFSKIYPTCDEPAARLPRSLSPSFDIPAVCQWHCVPLIQVDRYSDINASHDAPLSAEKQRLLRFAYYSTITHVDELVGVLLNALERRK